MKWTNEKPTVPGWYWYRDKPGREEVFRVCIPRKEAEPVIIVESERLYPQFMEGEWAGPIPEPTIHPVDAIKEYMAACGTPMDPCAEKWQRAICDEIVTPKQIKLESLLSEIANRETAHEFPSAIEIVKQGFDAEEWMSRVRAALKY